MRKAVWQVLSLFVVTTMLVLLAGCGGSGSGNTSGEITSSVTATAQAGGMYTVAATATYLPVDGANPIGMKIKYEIKYEGSSTKVESGELSADSNGSISYPPTIVYQDIQPVIITFEAKTGGLTSTSVTSIPAISGLSVSPQAIAFLQTEGAGTTKTVTASGGFTPYTVASASQDINAEVSGGTVTVTNLTSASASPKAESTTITVTDNKGNSQPIIVSYYK